MLNYVGTLLISWLIQGPWKDPSGFAFPRTEKFRYTGEMPTFFGTRIHAGVVIGLVLALVLWFVLAKTKWGFEIKLIGTNLQRLRDMKWLSAIFLLLCLSVQELPVLPVCPRYVGLHTAFRPILQLRSVPPA